MSGAEIYMAILFAGILVCLGMLVERPVRRAIWKRRLAKGIGGEHKYSRTFWGK